MQRILLFSFSFIALVASCTKQESSTSLIQDKQVYTIDDQNTIGNHFADAIKSDPETFDMLDAETYSEVTSYLNTMLNSAVVSQHVLNRGEEDGLDWEIMTVVDEESYAYTMPGGKVVLSTGILKAIQNESELLALLSNEMYFTDIDLLTGALKDEYSGIRIGNITLGNTDDEAVELITFLKELSFTEEEMLAADQRTISVMCPFNYDTSSILTLIERSSNMGIWQSQRPRAENWQEMLSLEIENCDNSSDEIFRSRYLEMTSTLP